MAVRPLVLFPDKHLSIPSVQITEFDSSLLELIQDLKDTLYAGPGVGLAAPQIGINKRVSIIDVHRKKGETAEQSKTLYAIINPRILSGEGTQTPREGCLSIPDLLANVHRAEKVTVETYSEQGEIRTIHAEGFEALALQHEIDHLNGKLFLDRVANLKTDVFRRKTYK